MDFRFESVDEDFRSEIIDFVDKKLPWEWSQEDLDPEDEKDSVLVRQFKKQLGEKAGSQWHGQKNTVANRQVI